MTWKPGDLPYRREDLSALFEMQALPAHKEALAGVKEYLNAKEITIFASSPNRAMADAEWFGVVRDGRHAGKQIIIDRSAVEYAALGKNIRRTCSLGSHFNLYHTRAEHEDAAWQYRAWNETSDLWPEYLKWREFYDTQVPPEEDWDNDGDEDEEYCSDCDSYSCSCW